MIKPAAIKPSRGEDNKKVHGKRAPDKKRQGQSFKGHFQDQRDKHEKSKNVFGGQAMAVKAPVQKKHWERIKNHQMGVKSVRADGNSKVAHNTTIKNPKKTLKALRKLI